jgi:regulator of protease activity HflC (stomatin/prohibitin superfamily)
MAADTLRSVLAAPEQDSKVLQNIQQLVKKTETVVNSVIDRGIVDTIMRHSDSNTALYEMNQNPSAGTPPHNVSRKLALESPIPLPNIDPAEKWQLELERVKREKLWEEELQRIKQARIEEEEEREAAELRAQEDKRKEMRRKQLEKQKAAEKVDVGCSVCVVS